MTGYPIGTCLDRRTQVQSTFVCHTEQRNEKSCGGYVTGRMEGDTFGGVTVGSVAMVVTNAFQKRLNYDAKEISQNCENICGDKTHQKLGGHIYPKRIRWLFPTLWSSHEFGHKFG